MPILLKSAEFQKRWQSVVELVTLIKTTLEVIECNFQLEKVSEFEPKEFYKGCTTKVILLTSDEDKPQDSSQFSQNLPKQ
ncbi:hypothetical protein ACLB2K_011790 [Fragaria x ananassa]